MWTYEKLTGKMGMGGGDVKLLALIGAFLGIKSLPFVILVSAVLGSLVGLAAVLIAGNWRQGGWRVTAIPYGPFLAGAALLYLFGVPELTRFLVGGD
jgi:leader peptidase (prepilin peptidase)/N-methyltransferase